MRKGLNSFMRYTIRWSFFIVFSIQFFFSNIGVAQTVAPQFIHRVWTIEDGLPINSLNDITVTDDGFVWIATNNGLVRFDGLTHTEEDLFTVYNKVNTPNVFSNISLRMLKVNESEFIALQSNSGGKQAIFWYKNRELKSIPLEEGITLPFGFGDLDKTGKFYGISNGKIHSFLDGVWKNEHPSLHLEQEKLADIKAINSNNIWVLSRPDGAPGGELLHIVDGEVTQFGKAQGLTTDNVFSISLASNKNLWAVTENGIEIIVNGKARLVHELSYKTVIGLKALINDPEMEERFILRTGREYLDDEYLITEHDLQLLPDTLSRINNVIDKSFSLITPQGNEATSPNWLRVDRNIYHDGTPVIDFPVNIRNATTDSIGAFWVIVNGELHYFKKKSIESYAQPDFDIENVYSLLEDNSGVLWAGALIPGAYRKQKEDFEEFEGLKSINTGRNLSILEDGDNNLWFGNLNGLFFWDRISEVKEVLPLNNTGLRSTRGLLKDRKGTIWIGSVSHIHSYSKENEWKRHEIVDHEENLQVRFIYEDTQGRIWIGSNDEGLLYFDESEQVTRKFEGNEFLYDQSIRSMYQDEEGLYWIGLNGYGMVRLELNNKNEVVSATSFNQTNGLHGQVIHSIIEDEYKRVWISSNSGIFWVAKSELEQYVNGEVKKIHSTLYTKNDGLPGMEGNGGTQSPGIKTKDGRILFSMIKGIAIIHPELINETLREVSTRIDGLVTVDSSYSAMSSEIVLTSEERNLQFNYSAYNLELASDNIRYRYKLEGYDSDWIDADGRKEIFYTNVPGGDYNFVVQASLFGFDWSENESVLAFSIVRYFYETVWFKLLIVFGSIMILYTGFRWRIRESEKREKELSILVDEQTSQLTEQAKRLIELDETKSKFFANVSHEFRTPLTLIIGPLEDLKRKFQREPKSRESRNMNIALHSSKRLLKLVNQVLDISKLESNAVGLSVKKVSIAQLLDHLCIAFSSVAERNNIILRHRFESKDGTIYADPEMMEKVFVNILSNAFKFTPEGGEITVTMEETDSEIFVRFEDTGEGIEESDLEHVFDRFYQTNESAKINQVGTGIGLALVKELVEIHSGSIHVESEFGTGSCFLIKFLKGKEHFGSLVHIEESIFKPLEFISGITEDLKNPEIFEKIKPVLHTKDEDRATVLLVEDNEDIRSYLSQHLSEQYKVLEAENGEKGLEVAGKELPDVVISDVMMPIMDGHTFSRKLRNNPETDFIPVMLLTAKAEHSDVLSGLEIGVEDYIIKPFNIEEVKLRVRNLLESRKTLTDRLISGGYSLKASGIKVKSEDIQFLEHIQHLIQENLSDEYFGVEELAQAAAMSRVTLNSKLKSVLNKTPREVIREFRLKSAEQLLKQKAGNISEVAYSVGFKSISQFSRAFKEEYQVSPRAFLANHSSDS
ncbi:MAG: hypothetical protein BalsKO_18890 [Balneolaceae bacterium]